jgi:cytochrome b561
LRLRNGDAGYGVVTVTLHWLTVALLLAQFTVGYLLAGGDDHGGHGGGHGRGHGSGHGGGHGGGHGRGHGGDDLDLSSPLLRVHVALGATILAAAVFRVVWRRVGGLPPWAPTLGRGAQSFATLTERALLVLLFAIPVTGLAVLLGDDDLLWLHIATHVAFFVALAAHVGLVLSRRLLPRMLGRSLA